MMKALVVGVILLFLGVGFQPAFANEVSISKTSDVEDDCECQVVNRAELLKVKLLLIKLEVLINGIMSKFKDIPEIAENFKEISKKISSLSEIYEEIKIDSPFEVLPKICDSLEKIVNAIETSYKFIMEIIEKFPILEPLSYPILMIVLLMEIPIYFLGLMLDCDWAWVPPP